jgi:single-stranded-DNA-specific exonuclease
MPASARWRLPEADSVTIQEFASSLGVTIPAARVLYQRGIRDAGAARQFLSPLLEDLHDPHLLMGMTAAVERLQRAIRDREKIVIYGDYDVDGTTSVVILKKAIELAGGTASFHVPHRLRDGYGMRPEVVEALAEEGVGLIVSVDTGIRASLVVKRANELGMDVIVTDHHLPEAELPPAIAVLNPNRVDCSYPDKNLCGVGVAFKLVQGLLAGLGRDYPRIPLYRADLANAANSLGSLEFSKLLIQEAKVAVSPGIGFGEYGEGYVRFALVENEQRIRQALRGLKNLSR